MGYLVNISYPDKICDAIISIIISSPTLLGIVAFSYISGYAWSFLIVTYLKAKNKGNLFVTKTIGNIVFGFLWFSIIHLPIHWILVGWKMDINKVFDNCVYDLIYGLFIQAIILALFLTCKKEK